MNDLNRVAVLFIFIAILAGVVLAIRFTLAWVVGKVIKSVRGAPLNIKYYESHVTIEPVFGPKLVLFKELAMKRNFRVAELVMIKDRDSTEERSNKDAFCTGRGATFEELRGRMAKLVHDCTEAGLDVWRYKIEAILLDVRCKAPKSTEVTKEFL